MAQKVNPIAVRLKYNRISDSSWFSDYYYATLLYQDFDLRNYLNCIKQPTANNLGFRTAKCIVHRYPKKSIIHLFCLEKRSAGPLRKDKFSSASLLKAEELHSASFSNQKRVSGQSLPQLAKAHHLYSLRSASPLRKAISLRFASQQSEARALRSQFIKALYRTANRTGLSIHTDAKRVAQQYRTYEQALRFASPPLRSSYNAKSSLLQESLRLSTTTRLAPYLLQKSGWTSLLCKEEFQNEKRSAGLNWSRGGALTLALDASRSGAIANTAVAKTSGFCLVSPSTTSQTAQPGYKKTHQLAVFMHLLVMQYFCQLKTRVTSPPLRPPLRFSKSAFSMLRNAVANGDEKRNGGAVIKGTIGKSPSSWEGRISEAETSNCLQLSCAKSRHFYLANIEAVLCKQTNTISSILPVKVTSLYQSAFLVAQEICSQLEQAKSFRQICKTIFQQIEFCNYVKGIRIASSGRLNGAEIAKTECKKYGQTSLHVFSDQIDYAFAKAYTPYGICGVKVWICFSSSASLLNKKM